jgi:hypothetical protein
VRLVTALIVEVVHGYGEVVCRVELAGIDILALNKRRGYAFRLYDSQLGITPGLIPALVITYLLSQVLDGLISTTNIEADGRGTEGEEAQERAMSKQHNGCRYLCCGVWEEGKVTVREGVHVLVLTF